VTRRRPTTGPALLRREVAASSGTRRGMTFLEVVFATAMLGIIGGAMFAAYGFAIASEAREQQRLGAAELANRLVLNYLDSPTGMPDKGKVIEGGPGGAMKYRWEMVEEPVHVVEAAADQRDKSRDSPLKNDRFINVTVRVWLGEESGGSRMFEATTPSATLSRMLDPISPRNPDSYMAMIQNSGDRERLIQVFMNQYKTSPVSGPMGFERGGGGVPAREAFGRGRVRKPMAGGRVGTR
jgi:type II secretory pathway pseudopilin PulG